MKIIASVAASMLATALLLSLLPIHGEEIVYESTVRFHVLAQSDSDEDQALKLKVRDAVLAYTSPILAACDSFEEACAQLEEETAHIKAVAEEIIAANGYSYAVTAALVNEAYPTRVYEDIALPRGTYTSMKIVIGEGEGKNWWCVLFPSLCNSFSAVPLNSPEEDYIAAGFTPNQYRMLKKDAAPTYKVRFKLLEMLSDLLGFAY